jgi:hypothetical protein
VPLAVEVGETDPHGAGEQETVQLTPLFEASLETVAVNWLFAPGATVALEGATVTVSGPETAAGTVIVAEADFDPSVTDVAVSVTVSVLGGAVVGAAYVVGVPLAVDVGETLPQGAVEQETLQLTPSFAESFTTIAVNCAVAPAATVAVELVSVTLI